MCVYRLLSPVSTSRPRSRHSSCALSAEQASVAWASSQAAGNNAASLENNVSAAASSRAVRSKAEYPAYLYGDNTGKELLSLVLKINITYI